jgi:signal peptidase I
MEKEVRLSSKEAIEERPEKKKKSGLRENIEAIIIAIILALFIRQFIIQAFKIPSGSMKNTLLIGDHILVNKFIYGVKLPFINKTIIPISEPDVGDIVVFKFPEDPKKDFIKRVVAVAGDEVQLKNKAVFVNGKPQSTDMAIFLDPHIFPGRLQPRDNLGPVTVPENSIFVMGDNRDQSYDSRFWGYVDLNDVKGKAFIIYWSWNKENDSSLIDYVRWNRIGTMLE